MKRTNSTDARRRTLAYTLVEMVVVITVIVVLAAILLVMWPGLQSSMQATQNADKIQAMLLIAKQKAIRDGVPTGVRLVIPDPTSQTAQFGPVKELVYIQQPVPFTAPIVTGSNGQQLIGTLQPTQGGQSSAAVTFTNVDFTGGLPNQNDWPVQPGDYLEINGGGLVSKIQQVVPSTSSLSLVEPVTVTSPTTNFRIVRQRRPMATEEPLELSGSIIVDLNQTLSPNVPIRAVVGNNTTVWYREILFSPSGSVVGRGTQSGDKIYLYVRDGSPNLKVTDGNPVIIAVQITTGFIGGYPVDFSGGPGGGDYFSNTRDPHGSGL